MAWRVGVEVPEELADQGLRVVQSDGEELTEDPLHDLRWPLTDPLGSIAVEWSGQLCAGGERAFEPGEYRTFKITRAGDNGRAVSRVSRGHYIAIAPETLARAETTGGPPPVAPENVIPEAAGLLAHHLLAGAEGEKLVLSDGGDRGVEIRSSTLPAYDLVGHRIEDAHGVAGPLFGSEPPRLQVDESVAPAQVVVGHEGPSPRRRPRQTAANFDDLRTWFDQHEPGWFFVRLYDAKGDLLDSLDFRYAKGLEAIEIEEHSPLPESGGHRPAAVRFRFASHLRVSPVDVPEEIAALRTLPPEGFAFPARPDAGQATLRLRAPTGREVEIVVRVPRVWWAFTSEGEGEAPPAWTDRPQRLSADDFQPTSTRRLSVLMPAPGWADAILVGLRGGSPRRVQVLRAERTADYPLRNLGEGVALRGDRRFELLLSVQTGTNEHEPATVAEVRPVRRRSRQLEEHRCPDLSSLSPARLMSVITRGTRSLPAADRRAVQVLRTIYYRRARNGGPLHRNEFLAQGLALVAALLQRGSSPRLPSRWRRRAELLAGREPAAVAEWQLRLRRGEAPGRAEPVALRGFKGRPG